MQITGNSLPDTGLGHEVRKHFRGLAPGQAYLVAEFRPRCGACGSLHPSSRTPPLDGRACPDCGVPAAEPQGELVPAALTGQGAWTWTAKTLLGLGRWLHSLSERFHR